ncbi:SM-like, degradation of cytoplasmic mRNAs and positively regulates transcription initiation [Thelotrema lepadinum]|nr:SM-like, degradation of cytoplasmic mRNAs and positively regulates transcription initiation [Thelotrema lepadinum]
MENLLLQELPPPGGPNHIQSPPPQSGAPPLPPQMFTTAAQLLDLTDTNLVLQDTIERIFVADVYADIPRGIYLVRGENVLMLGEIDLDKDDYIPPPFKQASPGEVHQLNVKATAERKSKEKSRGKKLGREGFEMEHGGEIIF